MNEEQQRAFLLESALRRQASLITLPTDPTTINLWFRELQEPIILFGETLVDRRQRLGVEVARRGGLEALPRLKASSTSSTIVKETKIQGGKRSGGEHLVSLRRHLTEYWFQNRAVSKSDQVFRKCDLQAATLLEGRPLTSICNLKEYIAVSDRDGLVSLLDETDLITQYAVKLESSIGHLSSFENQFLGSGVDGCIHLYSHDTRSTTVFSSECKVNMTAWHPSGQYFVSSSSDSKWHYWSTETTKQPLFTMHGHHPDLGIKSICMDSRGGALVGTGGGDGVMRVWDCRLGQSILTGNQHVQAISCMTTVSTLYITGGMDNKIVYWDLRKVDRPLCVIPAHTNSVTSLCALSDRVIASSSLDGTIKLWDTASLLASYLVDDACKLTGLCKSPSDLLYSCSFDRTVRQYCIK